MYCSAITMRLLVGRLTPAIRAKSVTPCGGPPSGPPRVRAALHRFQCHLRSHKRKKTTPACRCGLASLRNLRLGIVGLLMDSRRFRQPQLAISCTNATTAGGLAAFPPAPDRFYCSWPFAGLYRAFCGLFSYNLVFPAVRPRRPYEFNSSLFFLLSGSRSRAVDGSEGSALSIAAVTSAMGAMPFTERSTPCWR